MLKSVLITSSTSGLVLYQKEWVVLVEGKDMTRMLGGLMTTIQEFARQHTGMPVCYVSYENVAVSFVFDEATGLICTLFHDIHDGAEFGRLVAGSLLAKFIDTFKIYSREGLSPTPKFQTFQTKISEALEDAVSTILKKVKSHRGIRMAALVWNDDNIRVEGQLDDRIGMVANLQALLTFSNAIMQRASDTTSTLTLEMAEQYVCICRLSEATLVVICRTNVDRLVYLQSINETITLVEQVMEVISNLRGEL